jgi:hypothetical protein
MEYLTASMSFSAFPREHSWRRVMYETGCVAYKVWCAG